MNKRTRSMTSIIILLMVGISITNIQLSMENQNQYSLNEAFPNLNFTNPVDLQTPRDNSNRLFVVEQAGRILVFNNSHDVTTYNVFLDITDRVNSGGEEGLLGLAFHPDYAANGYFYVYYSALNPRRTILSRFNTSATDSSKADTQSETVILEIEQPYSNHNGGQILFSSEGYLYIAVGDGGSGGDPLGNAQNLSTLLGKILRIDVDNQDDGRNYSIPPDNPFVNYSTLSDGASCFIHSPTGHVLQALRAVPALKAIQKLVTRRVFKHNTLHLHPFRWSLLAEKKMNNSESYREEIYAYGFRNPWRMSYDVLTERLWVADVGQGNMEEIDIVIKGENYGWNIKEGTLCFDPPLACNSTGLVDPVWEYDHQVGRSITGGYVYRGQELSELIGRYIFGDFIEGQIWALSYDGVNPTNNTLIVDSNELIVSFGLDEQNEIYVVSYGGDIYNLERQLLTPTGPYLVILLAFFIILVPILIVVVFFNIRRTGKVE